ncbi:MAG: tRNA (adenosine(37)-N6)-threonylcarbamoyltransferase complex transferase subunit TsaD [Clostridiales bacterium]|jgi:N6-L-threonylcarbamoyladenine synthase|nr:tRNA (adenosine(37)-N6)-threonylcarbamoyltransferase complex transferase subunit TsaD [Clostridiales bacterium]
METDCLILGIETSCDETSAAGVKDGKQILSNIIHSQIPVHRRFGGVVPEIASRNHIVKINEVVDSALKEADVTFADISAIGVTAGPGLVGALLVGVAFAKAAAYAAKKPLIAVHHIEAHICANYLSSNLCPPFICLVASGGHTHLVYAEDYDKYEIIGRTRDDAAGEAFDKVARAIGLPYPGGVEIEKLAKDGNADAYVFPAAMKNDTDFSFSGLKSAVLNFINSTKMNGEQFSRPNLAASFQKTVAETLVSKAISACMQKNCKKIALAGGVSANGEIRRLMKQAAESKGIEFFVPPTVLCTDNAAMIAERAFFSFIKGKFAGLELNAYPNIEMGAL